MSVVRSVGRSGWPGPDCKTVSSVARRVATGSRLATSTPSTTKRQSAGRKRRSIMASSACCCWLLRHDDCHDCPARPVVIHNNAAREPDGVADGSPAPFQACIVYFSVSIVVKELRLAFPSTSQPFFAVLCSLHCFFPIRCRLIFAVT